MRKIKAYDLYVIAFIILFGWIAFKYGSLSDLLRLIGVEPSGEYDASHIIAAIIITIGLYAICIILKVPFG